MGDGDAENLAGRDGASKGGVGGGGAQVDLAADELEIAVADEGAGEQAGFDEDLEAVADAEDETAGGGEFVDGVHDGGEVGDGAAAEVVAIGEAAGENDGIDAAKRGGVVPDEFRGLREIVGDRVLSIVVAVASGKDDHAKFHAICFMRGGKY